MEEHLSLSNPLISVVVVYDCDDEDGDNDDDNDIINCSYPWKMNFIS